MVSYQTIVVSLQCNRRIHKNEVGHGKNGHGAEKGSAHAWSKADSIVGGLLFVWGKRIDGSEAS